MSKLAESLRALRGPQSQIDFAEKCGVSLRLIAGIESGDHTSLNTIRQISSACKLKVDQKLDLILAWLELELGDDFRRFRIEKTKDPTEDWIMNEAERQPEDVLQLFNLLKKAQREQILKTMRRPEVMACLPALNKVLDKLDESNNSAKASDSRATR